MLRSVVSTTLRQNRGFVSAPPRALKVARLVDHLGLQQQQRQTVVGYRFLSSEAPKQEQKQQQDGEEPKNEIVLTPGEQVAAASRLGMYAGIAVFAGFCGYYIVKELLPTKMSPNAVFNKALEKVREHPDVKRRFGDVIKGYGRDHNGKREGRRNFIEHTEYKNEEDNSNRTRVRFNLEGPRGKAFVFAEVSSAMKSGEFVYILVQDKSTGRVFNVVDNRSAMTAARLAGGSKEGSDAFSALLGGGSKSS